MKLPYFLIDAFTDRAFTGNPAAVYVLKEPLSDDLMQKIAAEMNLSETAFVLQGQSQPPCAGLRPQLKLISAVMQHWPAPTPCSRQSINLSAALLPLTRRVAR